MSGVSDLQISVGWRQLMDISELQGAVARRKERSANATQDVVEWDLNTKGLSERLAPFVFEMQDCVDTNGAPVRLQIAQPMGALNEPGVPQSGTGSALWTAAIGLARYLEHRYHRGAEGALAGRRVLELGCGTGLVSLVAAALGGDVVATDIPECIESVTSFNFEANAPVLKGSVESRVLVWGETSLEPYFAARGWDLVVASDVIYRSEHVDQLLQTLRGVVLPGRSAFVAFDRRGREGLQAFLRAVAGDECGVLKAHRPGRGGATEAVFEGGGHARDGGDGGGGDRRAMRHRVRGGTAEEEENDDDDDDDDDDDNDHNDHQPVTVQHGQRSQSSGFRLREVAVTEMPPGFRFVHFGLVELTRLRDYKRDEADISEILPGRLFVGDRHAAENREALHRRGITHVVNCTASGRSADNEPVPNFFHCEKADSFAYHRVELRDTPFCPLLPKLESAVAFIKEALGSGDETSRAGSSGCPPEDMAERLRGGERIGDNAVFLHCHAGSSRSGAVCVAYLMAASSVWKQVSRTGDESSGGTGVFDAALAEARKYRPKIMPNAGFRAHLRAFEGRLRALRQEEGQLGSDSSRSSPANDSRNFTSVRRAPVRVPEVAIPSSASLQTPNPPSKGGLSTSAQNSFSPLPTEAEAEVSAQEFADRRLMEKISEGEAQWGGYEEFKEAFRAGLLRGEADWAILARSVGD